MDPDMEQHYKELLHQWKNDEDNVKDELKEISTDVKELTKKFDDLVASTKTPEEQSSNEGAYIKTIRDFFNLLLFILFITPVTRPCLLWNLKKYV